ncbi:SSU ribosomal protein S30P sigma 54 modulation protein [Nitzschia inconspicua]|uniref:SSU ribosomal protein S30P sigma 54 modulation protein n=1 Tax=Nitzschia inconspicua TaxID=303405 RepID=A0A9K3L1G4_9STRA|nr:SSU ribosomal protein S30P sigma 54 modulation protein [Nitzschia inconspicua]KAG7353193.1 SSU ribosomal protein S30P sigma 54 modulation protein [Nitzschia inconspicua]
MNLRNSFMLWSLPIMSAAFSTTPQASKSSTLLMGHQQRHFGQSFTASQRLVSSITTTSTTALFMSSEVAGDVSLVITGNNIDLTPALQEYVEKRIGSILNKLGSGGIVRECDVHLSVCKNPKVKDGHRVDLTAILKGLTVHCKEETSDMYASIDAAASALSSKLRKYRTRRKEGWHAGNKMGEDLMNALEAAELDEEAEVTAEVEREVRDEAMSRIGDFIDPEEPNIIKVNSFDLEHAIPVKEAIFALDYVDHDFFVFKNEETGKPTVIYKRNAGGVGLIECA